MSITNLAFTNSSDDEFSETIPTEKLIALLRAEHVDPQIPSYAADEIERLVGFKKKLQGLCQHKRWRATTGLCIWCEKSVKPADDAPATFGDPLQVAEGDARLGTNDHLKAFALLMNERFPTGGDSLKATDYLKSFKLWDGKGKISDDARVAAVAKFKAELAPARCSPTVAPAQSQAIDDHG